MVNALDNFKYDMVRLRPVLPCHHSLVDLQVERLPQTWPGRCTFNNAVARRQPSPQPVTTDGLFPNVNNLLTGSECGKDAVLQVEQVTKISLLPSPKSP